MEKKRVKIIDSRYVEKYNLLLLKVKYIESGKIILQAGDPSGIIASVLNREEVVKLPRKTIEFFNSKIVGKELDLISTLDSEFSGLNPESLNKYPIEEIESYIRENKKK